MRTLKSFALAALALAAAFLTGSAWADTDELGLTPKHWYKFNGNFNSSGETAVTISGENTSNFFDGVNDQAMKVVDGKTHPWGSGVQYGNGAWSIVTVAKAVFSGSNPTAFWATGTKSGWFGLLANPEGTVVVAKGDGNGITESSLVADVGDLTSYHVYVIVYDGNATLSLYVDGMLVAAKADFSKSISGDFQLGAVNGGMPSGISRVTNTGLDDWRLYQKALTAGEVKTISYAFVGKTTPRVIAVNFSSDGGKIGATSDTGIPYFSLPGSGWNNSTGASGSITAKAFDTETGSVDEGTSATISYSCDNTWSWTTATCGILKGYLDDNSIRISSTDIPFERYDLILIAATDNDNAKFQACTVNGTMYTTEDGVGKPGSSAWGASQQMVPILGTNTMRIDGLTGELSIAAQNKSGSNRGCIAAIILVENSLTYAELTATVSGEKNWSEIVWEGDSTADVLTYKLTLESDVELNLDRTIDDLYTIAGAYALTINHAENLKTDFAYQGVKSVNYIYDCQNEVVTVNSSLLNKIKGASSTQVFTFVGSGSNGASIDFGDPGKTLSTHIVFKGGTHSIRVTNGNRLFATGATGDNPTVLVTDNATVNFTAKDVSGYGAGRDITGIIRVNGGSTVNFLQNGSDTFFYKQRLWIDPGALVTFEYGIKNNESAFRWQGGVSEGNEQIYVPASETDQTANPAILRKLGAGGFHLASDNDRGVAVFVGENSKLVFDTPITTGAANAQFKKFGVGDFEITGDVSVGANVFTVNDGKLILGGVVADLTLVKDTAVEVAENKVASIAALHADGKVITKTGAGTLKLPNAYAGAISLAEGRIDQTFVGTLTFAGDLTFTAAELPLISTLAASGHTGSIKLPEGFFGQIAKISGEGKPSDLVIKDSTGAEITEGFAKDADGYLVLKADEITTVAEVSRPTEFVGAMRFGEGGGISVKHATPDTPMYYTSDAITVAEGKKAVVTLDLYGQYEVGTRFIMLTGASLPAVENFTCQLGATPARTTITPTVEGYGTGQALVFTIATSLISTQDDATKAALAKAVAHFDAGRFETLTLDDAGNISKWTNLGSQGETYDATPAGNGRAANDFPTFAIVDGRAVLDFGECNSQKDLGFTRVAIKAAIQVIQLKNDKRAWFLGDYGPEGKGTYSFHRDQANANPPLFNGNSKVTSVFDNGVDRGNGRTGVYPETMRVISVATDSAECYTDCFTMDRNNGDNRSGGRKLCETLLFTEELTAEERAAIEAYLNEKWNLYKTFEYSGEVALSAVLSDVEGLMGTVLKLADGTVITLDAQPTAELTFMGTGAVTLAADVGTSLEDADIAKIKIENASKVVYKDLAYVPATAPAADVTNRWEGSTALASIPYPTSTVGGVLELACPVTALSSDSGALTGDKALIIFDDGFSATSADRWSIGNNGQTVQNYLQLGGEITLTRDGDAAGNGGNGVTPFLMAHWPSTVNYTQLGGSVSLPNGSAAFGWDGTIVYVLGGGDEAASFSAKGLNGSARDKNEKGNSSFTISTNGTLSVGDAGFKLNSTKSLILAGGKYVAAATHTVQNGSVNVAADSTIEVPTDMTLTITSSMSGDGAIAKTGAGALVLGAARPKLGAIAGKIRFVATAEEVLASEIVIPTTEESYADGLIEVFDGTGVAVEVERMTVSEGKLTITLPNNVIAETSSVSAWKAMKGEVVIKAEDEEAELTITVDDAFSTDITAISIFGKVTFIFEDVAAASTVPLNIQNGGSVSISGPVPAVPMTIASGATLTLNDGTSFAGQITVNGGAELIVDGAVTANAVIAMPGAQNSKLTVNPGAVLALTQSSPFSGNNGTFNIYGTIDVSGNWEYNSNPATAIFNFYAGSTLTGAGHWNMAGGYNPRVNVFDFDSPTKYVTFDIVRGHGGWNQPTEFKVKDPGVGIKILKNFDNTNNTISGSDICGIELAVGGLKVTDVDENTKTKVGGTVKIAAGATLALDTDDAFTNEVAALDLQIAGTLNGNNHSQDITALNVTNNMTIANGVFPNATVTVKEGVTLKTTENALIAANVVANGAVNGAVKVTGTLSGSGSVTTATLADGAYLDATAGALTIPNLLAEGEKIVIKCKASGGALAKGLTADPSANVKLIDLAGAEIPLRKGRFVFKDGELSFKFNAFMLMLK